MIIAVDYDGTLEINGKTNHDLLAWLQSQQCQGHVVILWTCREGERLAHALDRLARAGFAPNLVNANAPNVVARLGHDPRKVYADLYIDDKSTKP